jgi:hypothetical protein
MNPEIDRAVQAERAACLMIAEEVVGSPDADPQAIVDRIRARNDMKPVQAPLCPYCLASPK